MGTLASVALLSGAGFKTSPRSADPQVRPAPAGLKARTTGFETGSRSHRSAHSRRAWVAVKPLAVLLPVAAMTSAILLLDARTTAAKPEYTRRTKKECLFCHPPDSFQLNEAGKYYKEHRTLDGYDPNHKPKMNH